MPGRRVPTARRPFVAQAAGCLVVYALDDVGEDDLARRHNCVVVSPYYRTAIDAPYPAAVNDLHAAWQWILDNAEERGFDTDNIVMFGCSSGAGLALNLGFRLKRYGIAVKGILAGNPITDDRETKPSSKVVNTMWDGRQNHECYSMWLGINRSSARIGPEAMANHATVEDCIGYSPCSISTCEYDSDSDNNREFHSKLKAARTFAEYYSIGGLDHTAPYQCAEAKEFLDFISERDVEKFFKYDFRRPWVVDEYREKILKQLG